MQVCNDITAYLPQNTETRQGLTIMNDEFITYSTSKVMVINITYNEAENINTKLKSLKHVKLVDFDDSEDHYNNGCALFNVTLTSTDGSPETQDGYTEIREALSGYDTYFSESDSDDSAALDARNEYRILNRGCYYCIGFAFYLPNLHGGSGIAYHFYSCFNFE